MAPSQIRRENLASNVDKPSGLQIQLNDVGSRRIKLRDEFFTYDKVNTWEEVQVGTGMAITVAGAANGARYLNIATGTTINQETILQSKETVRLPARLSFGLSMSQRIINQEVFVELVGVDAKTGAVDTDATFVSTNLNNASNAASFKFDGTTAANAIYLVRGDGISEMISGSTGFVTTVATGTSPNFLPVGLFDISADFDEVAFLARSVDSNSSANAAIKRTQLVPNPYRDYKVRIRVRNLGIAPASTTDVRIHRIDASEFNALTVDFGRFAGRFQDSGNAFPALIVNNPTISGLAAHGATNTGNPTKIGARAKTSLQTAVTNDQITDVTARADGALFTQPGAALPVTEVASAARTASGNSGTISIPSGGSISGFIAVSAASGTTPTLDLTLEESFDNGTTYQTAWSAPRFVGTGNAPIPAMAVGGLRRWAWTIGGTTPSFTFAITVNQLAVPCPIIRKSFDRTAGLLNGTLSNASAALYVAGCTQISAKVNLGAATTPGTYQIQIADVNGDWSNVGTATAAIASGTMTLVAPLGITADYARVICTAAATGQTGNYVSIQAIG